MTDVEASRRVSGWPKMISSRWADGIDRWLDRLVGALLALITMSLIYQVFGRYVLGRAPGWSEEVARFAIVWLTMLGAAGCLRSGGHIAITVLLDAVSPQVRVALLWVRDTCILLTAGVLAWSGARYALLNSGQDSPALEIPMTWAYACLGVGAMLIALQLVLSRLARETPRLEPLEW